MIRDEELKSPRGKAAYELYSYWLLNKRKGSHTLATFGQSKCFQAFYRYVGWANKVKLPDKRSYIRYMNIKDYQPTMWTDPMVYTQYLEWIDFKWTAEEHFKVTYTTLKKISEAAECPMNEAIFILHPNELMLYVRARKLSPWVLLRMKGFKKFLQSLTVEQQTLMRETIRPSHWGKILQDPAKEEENMLIREATERAGL